ncbi:histidine kinase [Geotalea uraniireducens]|uniref:histidine kinase n=1 Tax=Geotalea uraniireducens TaxID=351604 RepID=A0ABM8ELX2_9BACT|nr:PAS domain-containing sensor histidine kinase [Geotalea uraniireducens]BDV43572.1 histidine kinase [Geotalea uraniireducens]
MKQFPLFRKILLAMLVLSLVPLLVSSLILALNLRGVRGELVERSNAAADLRASESLRLQAEQVADSISAFLGQCEADLLLCAALPRTPAVLTAFYDSRRGEVWHRAGSAAAPREVRELLPCYSALAIVDRNGRETFAIREGRVVAPAELRNVATPAGTEYRREEYFKKTRRLARGEIYVSHLTGYHLSRNEQLAGAPDPESAYGGQEYRGVIRFATPLFDRRGTFAGIVVLSLDHRQLMEFTQHINPGQNRATVFPSYKSGNYAFLFDDEGWIITHPKYWDIRGVDRAGRLVPPYTSHSSPDDISAGRIPFNLDDAGFIHPNYPRVAELVREGKSGFVDITNVGGAKKIMAFAPIRYHTGDYRRYGIFGGVTIGFQVDQFHESARTGAGLINRQLRDHLRLSAVIVAATSLLVAICAWFLSRGITRPLAQLTDGVRRLAAGDTGSRVEISGRDEVGELAISFNRMAEELEQRKNSLLRTLDELELSRRSILDERNFKESILESISSAIMTVSPNGQLTSVNGTGRAILGEGATPGVDCRQLFAPWGALARRLDEVLTERRGYGRTPLTVERYDQLRHFEIGFFPIGSGGSGGTTVTMRDETERERFREEMARLDRLASLGKLAAGIAHEVRNPLTGVALLLDDLHDSPGLDPENQAMMSKALQELERVERLVAALLNYSSPPKACFRTGDLNRVIQDTLLLLRREGERQRVTMTFTAGELPPFRFDVEKIKQALLNLVKNALEAVPNGGNVEICTATAGTAVTVTIADNGPGIAEADLPLIFEPFFTCKGTGTGLGLSITQQVVEEHHGRVTVASSRETGTVFTISLPAEA